MKIIERKIPIATTIAPSLLEKLEAIARKNHLTTASQHRQVLENFVAQNAAKTKPAKTATTSRGNVSLESLPKTFKTSDMVSLYLEAGATKNGAAKRISALLKAGAIEKLGLGEYRFL